MHFLEEIHTTGSTCRGWIAKRIVTRALRQYARCVAVLQEELNVKPSRLTIAVYRHIKEDLSLPPEVLSGNGIPTGISPETLTELLLSLEAAQATLSRSQQQISKEIEIIRDNLALHS